VSVHDLVDPGRDRVDSADPALARIRGILGERFRVDGPIAKGCGRTVYSAFDRELGREVAIKVLDFDTAGRAELVDRLEERLRSAAELGHRGVLAPTHLAVHDGIFLYIGRMAPGGSAADALRAGERSSWGDVQRIVSEAAAALARAHERGMMHGGVTPSNILFFPDGAVRVADFGIAEALADAGLVDGAAALRASAYRAPRQRSGSPADAAADQYALAAVAYELLMDRTRLVYFGDDSVPVLDPIEVLANVPVAPGVPLHANAALRTALDPEPGNRFASIADFADAFVGNARVPRQGLATRPPELRLRRRARFPLPLGWLVVGLLMALVLDPSGGAALRGMWNSLWDAYSPPPLSVDVSDFLTSQAGPPRLAPQRTAASNGGSSDSWLARARSAVLGSSPSDAQPAYILVRVDSGAATVTIDGVRRGETPLVAAVGAGHHLVSIAGPSVGKAPLTGVVVAAGDTARVSYRTVPHR